MTVLLYVALGFGALALVVLVLLAVFCAPRDNDFFDDWD